MRVILPYIKNSVNSIRGFFSLEVCQRIGFLRGVSKMDLDFAEYVTSKLLIVREILLERSTFINVDETQNILFNVVLFLKCVLAGYGMRQIVPQRVTFAFLFVNVCTHFFTNSSWSLITGEVFHALTQIGIFIGLNEEIPVPPNITIWYAYCMHIPSEFVLDCYVTMAIFIFMWQNYVSKPHKLCSLICVLFALNWFTDMFVVDSGSAMENVLRLYIPVILIESLDANDQLLAFPDVYVAVWMIFKLSRVGIENTPAMKYKESFDLYIKDKNFTYFLDEVSARKPFLNVEEDMHDAVFYFLLLLKSFVAAYAIRNIVDSFTTLKLMSLNWILAFSARNVQTVLSGLVRFVINTVFQYVFHAQQYSLASSSCIWFWVCVRNNDYHFFLDVYLIVAAFIYSKNAYADNLDKISTLLCFAYCVDWVGEFIGEPFDTIAMMSTLYFPVIVISALSVRNWKRQLLSISAFTCLWFVLKFNKDCLDCAVRKYVYNFYQTAESFVRYLNDQLDRNRIRRGVVEREM